MAGENNSGVGLNIANYRNLLNSTGSNTNSSSATGSYAYGAANTGNSNKSIWETLIGTTPGLIASASTLVTAIKADPNKIAQYQGSLNSNFGNLFNGGNNNAPRNNNWIWIAIGVLLVIGLAYWAMKSGKAA